MGTSLSPLSLLHHKKWLNVNPAVIIISLFLGPGLLQNALCFFCGTLYCSLRAEVDERHIMNGQNLSLLCKIFVQNVSFVFSCILMKWKSPFGSKQKQMEKGRVVFKGCKSERPIRPYAINQVNNNTPIIIVYCAWRMLNKSAHLTMLLLRRTKMRHQLNIKTNQE